MFPDHRNYNIIAFGGQESGSEKDEEVDLISNYLKADFERVEFVGKGEIFMVVYVKKND